MTSSIIIYSLLLVAPIYLFMAIMAFRSKEVEGYFSFGLLMITAGIYSLGYFFEIHSLSQEEVFNWLRFEYLGLAPMPALWLIFVMRYCGYSRWLSKPIIAALWLIPVVTILMMNTNPSHSLFYTSLNVDFTQGLAIASVNRGPWYWMHIGYFNVALLVGSFLLLHTFIKSRDSFKNRYLFLFLGSLVPWVTLTLYLLGLTPMNLDLSPFGILLTGIIYIYNAINYKMFDFLALARANVFDSIQDAILVLDANGRLIDMNSMAEKQYGLKGLTVGQGIGEILKEYHIQANLAPGQGKQFCGEKLADGIYKMHNKEKWIELRSFALRDKKGSLQGDMVILRDITANKQAEEALRKSEEKYRLIFEHSPLGIFHFNQQGIITDCNDSFVKIVGSSRQKIVGIDLHTLPDEKFKKASSVVLDGELSNYEDVYHSVTVEKSTPVRALFAPLCSLDKRVLGGVGMVEDITERKSYEQKLKYLSLHDKLTGIYNRAFFEEELKRLQEKGAYPITVISCDLDGLKTINDTMGHGEGDKLLQCCTEVLSRALRKEDILARLGGDEFAIILPYTDQLAGGKIVQRVRNIEAEYNLGAKELTLSISMGVATAVDSSKDMEEVVKEADERMYHEKLIRKAN